MNAVTSLFPAIDAAVGFPERSAFELQFGNLLVQRGRLTAAGLERAMQVRDVNGERLEILLVNLGLVAENDVVELMAAQLGLPVARLEEFPAGPVLEAAISPKFLRESGMLPVAVKDGRLTLAMADPLDTYARHAIQMSTGLVVEPVVAAASDIQVAHERLAAGNTGQLGRMSDEIDGIVDSGASDDIDRLRDLASEAPVIRLVNLLIVSAIEARASDIHIEPFRHRLVVRYRIDGVLREATEPPGRLRAAVVSRIKIMANLNIAERRLPQDGRIRFAFRGRELDLRVSTMPTLYGETAVLRILDRAGLVDDFGRLGFGDRDRDTLLSLLDQPQGIVLVTGPTGSGKTTTLYTGLQHLNRPGRKLYTVEDPVEYELEGTNQVQVRPKIGLTFANILRSILRQDPDVIMVGEIRDLETAEIAVQAALTGHLVLSTLHTNDAASSVTRLLDMGVPEYLIASTLTGVVAQRLVRCLCPSCHQSYHAPADLQVSAASDGPALLYRATGCPACDGSGYRGRTTIAETLVVSDSLRRQILNRGDARSIQRVAQQEGMRSMYQDGMAKALAGISSKEEVLRVIREAP